ncbi:hypothetical protein V8V91_27485 [Algoriphagus halophilus]|uniref:hypothetical protein n=1 Tax=Algoriphagus halophilus TaxID=226505 RepID=UPI00358E5721
MKIGIRFFLIICLSFFSCEGQRASDKISVDERLTQLVNNMEEEFLTLNEEIIRLGDFYQYVLANRDSLLKTADRSRYTFEGSFSNNLPVQGEELSKLILSTKSPDPEKSMEEVLFTNILDSAFKAVYEKHPIIAQVYTNSPMQVSRVYPPYDAQNLMDPDIDLVTFNFYYEGDLEHNPEKEPIWLPEVYVDPAGKGWIMSLVYPVYDGDDLFAVLGIDITVEELLHRFLEREDGNLLIVNGIGDIVSGKSTAIEALSFPPLKNHVYTETIKSDNFRISDFNLFNSKSRQVREMGQEFLFKKEKTFLFENENDLKEAIAIPFNFTDWYLIEINPY